MARVVVFPLMNSKLPFFALALASLGAGCTFPSRTSIYDRSSAGRSMNVDMGSVVGVRDVQISGRNTVVGVGGGAILGSAAASGGNGVGGAVVQAAGAVGGAILGESVEEVATRKSAQEIMVKMSNGDTIAVVQPIAAEGMFRVGEQVQVLQGGAGAQVRRMY
jgi:outer membrane lipoprotein SlyB